MAYIPNLDLPLGQADELLASLSQQELLRLRTTLQLIPSENFASRAVLEMTGSVFSNKYAEGYPGKRYYEGNEIVDQVETLAIERAKQLFGAEHANVQLLSGGPANMCVYEALLQEGDTVLSMDLAQGGHLTHGAKVNFSGKRYRFVHYQVDTTSHIINMDEVRELALRERPKMIVAGASAYPRIIDFAAFRAIADEVGALLLSDISHIAGLIAGKVHPDAVAHSHIVTSTTHKTLRGPRGAIILCKKEFAEAIDKAVFPRVQAGPHMNTIAAKAVAFQEALNPNFTEYVKAVVENASVLAQELTRKGWKLTTGGTDNHLMVMDLSGAGISGKKAASILADAGIIANKNMIPYDQSSPMITSGVRLGTPAMTSRGLNAEDMKQIASWIAEVLSSPEEKTAAKVRKEIAFFLEKYPLYSYLD